MREGVIITGGAKRVGAAMALYFAKAGYDIALHYNRSKKEALALQKKVRAAGVKCEIFEQDLSKISALPGLIKKIKAAMPNVTTLVNNASVFNRKELLETDEAFFDHQFAINFKAPFFMTQAFARQFKKGSVVNILDTDISKNYVSHFAYLVSKKALADFTKMAAVALGPNIRVNGVAPGYVLASSTSDAAFIKKVKKTLPLGEHATLEEVLSAVLWLSQQARVTGNIVYVDGGKHVV